MKKLFILTALMMNSSAFATLHLQKGQVATVVVEGCKKNEYGIVFSKFDSSKITARCEPKICYYLYHSNEIMGGPRATIQLLHTGQVLAEPTSKYETQAILKELIKNEVCAETRRGTKLYM